MEHGKMEKRNDGINGTCNQVRVKYFGTVLKLLGPRVLRNNPINLVQIGAIVKEDEHAD